MIRQLFSMFFLMCLQGTSLMLSAMGSVFQSAGSMVHVTFVQFATRHDLKYALKPNEIATKQAIQEQKPTASKAWN